MKTRNFKQETRNIQDKYSYLAQQTMLTNQSRSTLIIRILSLGLKTKKIIETKTAIKRKEAINEYDRKKIVIERDLKRIADEIKRNPRKAKQCKRVWEESQQLPGLRSPTHP